MTGHAERKHSKFAASAMDRIFECPGSVNACEGLPDQQNPWSIEGTNAHEVHEYILKRMIRLGRNFDLKTAYNQAPPEIKKHPFSMFEYAFESAKKIIREAAPLGKDVEIIIEERVYLDFVDKEAFGTLDTGIVALFDTVQIVDYKFGKKKVSPVENKQLIFYLLALAHKYNWNFSKAKLSISQPRLESDKESWELQSWEADLAELKKEWVPKFKKAIKRAREKPDLFVPNEAHCYWCKAKKNNCPAWETQRIKKANKLFGNSPD